MHAMLYIAGHDSFQAIVADSSFTARCSFSRRKEAAAAAAGLSSLDCWTSTRQKDRGLQFQTLLLVARLLLLNTGAYS